MKTANYIEGKLEEFRLSNKTPSWIGLELEVMKSLALELEGKTKNSNVEVQFDGIKLDAIPIITEFLGVRVFTYTGSDMPVDGVYIQEKNATNDGGDL